MPKNKKGFKGRRRKHRKKRRGKNNFERELILKEKNQEYAKIIEQNKNSNYKYTAICYDGKIRTCILSGKMSKRIWLIKGDFILISLREFQDNKANILLKYNLNEIKKLKQIEQNTSKNLVFGYIKKLEISLSFKLIPNDIMVQCLSIYYNPFFESN